MAEQIWRTPIKIGNLQLKNRIVYPPLSSNWGTAKGEVTQKITNYYREQADGGCSMVIVEGTAVSLEGRGSSHSLCFAKDGQIPSFSEIAASIRQAGAIPGIQLLHAGGQANPMFTGFPAVSPSGVPCKAIETQAPHVLSVEEIAALRGQFAEAARRVADAGFMVIELHLAHGYLLHEFLSPHTNHRTDMYGGNAPNRARLIIEILEDLQKVSPRITVGARISGWDYLEDGISEPLNRELLPSLADAGVEYFHVTAGIYDTGELKHAAMKRGEFFDYARGVKSITTKPVIGVGKVLSIEQAEKHLEKGDCDIVAIGRGLLADPQMVNRALAGETYNSCIECRKCMYLRYGREYLKCPIRPI